MDRNNSLIKEGKRLIMEMEFLLDAIAIGRKSAILEFPDIVIRMENVMEDIEKEYLTQLIVDHPELMWLIKKRWF